MTFNDVGINNVATAEIYPRDVNTVRIPKWLTRETIGKFAKSAAIATIDVNHDCCAEI